MTERWSGKRVEALLEELSGGQKYFKTKPTGTPVKDAQGYKNYPNGYFHIDGAYGGYKLVYNLPYSSAITEVTSGFVSSGKLADRLLSMGSGGLKARFDELQRLWKPTQKERFMRRKKG